MGRSLTGYSLQILGCPNPSFALNPAVCPKFPVTPNPVSSQIPQLCPKSLFAINLPVSPQFPHFHSSPCRILQLLLPSWSVMPRLLYTRCWGAAMPARRSRHHCGCCPAPAAVFGGQPSEIHRMPQKVPRTDREPWLRLARCFIICHCDRAPDGHHHRGLEHLQCRGVEGQRPDCFPASPQAAAAHLTNPLTFSSCPSVQCPMEWNIPLVSGWKVSSLIPSVAWCHKETEQSVITHSIQDTGPKVQRSLQR